MLNTNTLFGFVLTIAATVIGAHAWDNSHYAKTELVAVAKCFGQPPIGEVKCDPVPLPTPQPIVCPPRCDELLSPSRPDVVPIIKVADTDKKISAKKKSFLGKGHRHHKSKVTHHHKSKPHHTNHSHGHHHHGHGHGGHGHNSPQKIPSHGAPPHLTGPPGCR